MSVFAFTMALKRGSSISIPRERVRRLVPPALAALLAGCATGQITGVQSINAQRNADAPITIEGTGVCTELQVDFGDGTAVQHFANVALPGAVHHTYTGWTGFKKVTATGVTNCQGSASGDISVLPLTLDFGYGAGRTACNALNMPPLRKNVVVTMKWINPPGAKVDFGCLAGLCVHEPDGEAVAASSKFAFPSFRKYSLMVRVGTQGMQGGNDFTFTTTQSGPLELCMNDEDFSDNSGAWGIDIGVDERQATP